MFFLYFSACLDEVWTGEEKVDFEKKAKEDEEKRKQKEEEKRVKEEARKKKKKLEEKKKKLEEKKRKLGLGHVYCTCIFRKQQALLGISR